MASFRQRLQHKHNLSLPLIQTNDIPPPPAPAPWLGGSLSACTAGADVAWSAHPASAHPACSSAPGPKPAISPSPRPPHSPRGFSGGSAAVLTGQSRFVEGSMNDRVSTAPPPVFLGLDDDDDDDDDEDGSGGGGDGRGNDRQREANGCERGGTSCDVADADEDGTGNGNGNRWGEEWGLVSGRRFLTRGVMGGGRGGGYGGITGGGGGGGMTSASRYALRRPRSAAGGWYRSSISGPSTSTAQQESQQGGAGNGGVVKKTSFLGPLWDGVREKLHLNKSKSSGSIGRVVSSVVGGGPERKVDREKAKERLLGREEKAGSPEQAQPSRMAGYPSREEVLESYKSLMASGFFEAHAIRGGRHPLRTGGANTAAATNETRSFVEHMATSQNAASSSAGKSFADHMAAVRQQRPPPALPLSSPVRSSMGPTPPLRDSSRGKSASLSSPFRGTKRGASLELASDAELVTRKFVKKLRHSASRLSVDLTGARKKSSQHELSAFERPRPSTSPNPVGHMSPTSSIFSNFPSPPLVKEFGGPTADRNDNGNNNNNSNNDGSDNTSIRLGRLAKPKDGGRRRILGLTRKRPFSGRPSSVSTVETGPDVMMVDEKEEQQQQQPEQQEPQEQEIADREQEADQIPNAPGQRPPKARRNFTPPPAAFLTHARQSVRIVNTSESDAMSLEEKDGEAKPEPEPESGRDSHNKHPLEQGHKNEDEDKRPLSVMPDPNQGIPLVPRIPREFCDAMAALVPPAPVVVAGSGPSSGGEATKKMKKKMGREEVVANGEDLAKLVYRDSGLGDDVDVENIPVWGS
ncbi:hypothetical protein VTH82DRAFT_8266 [Thermothelomyces myriococcoides]